MPDEKLIDAGKLADEAASMSIIGKFAQSPDNIEHELVTLQSVLSLIASAPAVEAVTPEQWLDGLRSALNWWLDCKLTKSVAENIEDRTKAAAVKECLTKERRTIEDRLAAGERGIPKIPDGPGVRHAIPRESAPPPESPAVVERCNCSCGDECPLGRTGMDGRCTAEELRDEVARLTKDRDEARAENEKLAKELAKVNADLDGYLKAEAQSYGLDMDNFMLPSSYGNDRLRWASLIAMRQMEIKNATDKLQSELRTQLADAQSIVTLRDLQIAGLIDDVEGLRSRLTEAQAETSLIFKALARSTNYVADHEQFPQRVEFDNGRVVTLTHGFNQPHLDIGWSDAKYAASEPGDTTVAARTEAPRQRGGEG